MQRFIDELDYSLLCNADTTQDEREVLIEGIHDILYFVDNLEAEYDLYKEGSIEEEDLIDYFKGTQEVVRGNLTTIIYKLTKLYDITELRRQQLKRSDVIERLDQD